MRISTYHNDKNQPTVTIDSFESRTYRMNAATSLVAVQYQAFCGRILETIVCPEKIEEFDVTNLVHKLISKYSNPDTNIIVASDTNDNGNSDLEEISAIQVTNYIDLNNEVVSVRDSTVVIYKKHTRDIYINAVAKLAYEIEFGEGSYR